MVANMRNTVAFCSVVAATLLTGDASAVLLRKMNSSGDGGDGNRKDGEEEPAVVTAQPAAVTGAFGALKTQAGLLQKEFLTTGQDGYALLTDEEARSAARSALQASKAMVTNLGQRRFADARSEAAKFGPVCEHVSGKCGKHVPMIAFMAAALDFTGGCLTCPVTAPMHMFVAGQLGYESVQELNKDLSLEKSRSENFAGLQRLTARFVPALRKHVHTALHIAGQDATAEGQQKEDAVVEETLAGFHEQLEFYAGVGAASACLCSGVLCSPLQLANPCTWWGIAAGASQGACCGAAFEKSKPLLAAAGVKSPKNLLARVAGSKQHAD